MTLLAVATSAVAAVVAIDRGLPADFAGILDGDSANVLGEFLLWRGTAIAPPFPLIVAMAVLAFLAPQHRLATGLLTAIGAGGVVGYLGEPQTWDAHPLYTPLVMLGIALFTSVAVLGARELRGDYAARTVVA
ncbi:MAG: hypothetical protein H0V45_11280 [Actinobacteria bacterium]|nr:hypothetical protein [Actinomycetota bacterium]